MNVGTVISGDDTPNSSNFSFVSTKDYVPFLGDFLESQGVVGQVVEIRKKNSLYEDPSTVSEFHNISKDFPEDDYHNLIVDCIILSPGEVITPKPGSVVVKVSEDKLSKILGLNETGLNLGKVIGSNLDAKVKMSRLIQKHLALLAMSGAGKSNLAAVLIEEMLERKKQDGRPAVVVLDLHGDYKGFASSPEYAEKTKVIDMSQSKVSVDRLNPRNLEKWSGASEGAIVEYSKIFKEFQGQEDRSFEKLNDLVKNSGINPKTLMSLESSLNELNELDVFASREEQLNRLVKNGSLLILDFTSVDDFRKLQLLASTYITQLYRLRKENKIPPLMLVVEEAHNYCPERAESDYLARNILETIAREGRKFGFSLCIISQRPNRLSTTILSQCNSFCILRIMNPNDTKKIQESCESLDYNYI
ncbi:DNA double-strand break repair helicase HerA [uncultured archaeon]|nr:DNA double-strand break repair helicase HerA [uncultured archaeon]